MTACSCSMPRSGFVALAISAVSVGDRCCVQAFHEPPAAPSFLSFRGSLTLVLHSVSLVVVLADIEVSPLHVVATVCFASAPLRSIVPSSSLSL